MSKQSVKSLTIEEYELCNKLKTMRFSGMAAELEKVFSDPNADLFSFNDKIQRIIDAEWDLREPWGQVLLTRFLLRLYLVRTEKPWGQVLLTKYE